MAKKSKKAAEAAKQEEQKVKAERKAAVADTVTVALCHPQGICFLLNDGKKRVTINGNAVDLRHKEMGILPQGGFGLTEIPAADWEAIKKTYGSMEIFKNGLIFAHERASDTDAEAAEKKELRHGREPVKVEGGDKETPHTEPASVAAMV